MPFDTQITRRSLLASLLAITLTACGTTGGTTQPTAIAQPTSVAAATVVAGNTSIPAPPATAVRPSATAAAPSATVVAQRQPVIAFQPQAGGPGTTVKMSGSGFVAGAPVIVRLGLPHPMGEALASAAADNQGHWSTNFVLPGALPSGDPISTRTMFLVAMSDANVALASAPFAFEPAAPTPYPTTPAEQSTATPQVSEGPHDTNWQTLTQGDVNDDSIYELVAYNPAVDLMNKPSSVPVSGDTKVIATDMVISQGNNASARVLFSLNQQQIVANGKVLASFGSVTPAGFVIGVTAAQTYSFEIAPVNAAGQEYTQHIGIAWDANAGTYRITNPNMQQ